MKLIHLSDLHLGKRVGEASLQDAHGAVDIYLLPFVKPLHVAHFCDERTAENLRSYSLVDIISYVSYVKEQITPQICIKKQISGGSAAKSCNKKSAEDG